MAKICLLVILLLAIFSLINANTTIARRETEIQTTDRLLFDSPIDIFLEARNKAGDYLLNFTSDGCSKVADKPLGFDFLASCERHDFGYRNYKKLGLLNDENRAKINKRFREDMGKVCSTVSDQGIDFRYPIATIIAEAVKVATTLVDLAIKIYKDLNSDGNSSNDSQITSGDLIYDGKDGDGAVSYRYSPRDVCEKIADTYYEGVTMDGWIRNINGACRYGGASGNICFWGVYALFFTLVFGYRSW